MGCCLLLEPSLRLGLRGEHLQSRLNLVEVLADDTLAHLPTDLSLLSSAVKVAPSAAFNTLEHSSVGGRPSPGRLTVSIVLRAIDQCSDSLQQVASRA